MITTVKADGVQEYAFIDTLKKRAQNSDKNVIPVVSEILENVRENGDKAVREYTVKFDGKAPEHTEITAEEIDNIVKLCDPELLATFRKASDNIADFHRRQVQRRDHGTARARLKARGHLCSGRYRCSSVIGTDECDSREACGR